MPRRNSGKNVSPAFSRAQRSGKSSPQNATRPLNITAALGESFVETKRGKDYTVRKTLDGQSVYKCPNCNQQIKLGEPSFTVIEKDHIFGEQAAIDERRHWHISCWRRFR